MDIVTGSFGYIGKYVTRKLIEGGRDVRTITTHPNKPNPFGERVQAYSYHFENPEKLTEILSGGDILFNTYWVRFNYQDSSFEKALANTVTLFDCAKKAGIKKIIHISVTNPAEDDPLPYYKGKALQEKALKESGIPFTIVRPTLVFGKEDILVNNIAWTIRKFPIVPIFGSGNYRVQPVLVDDLASICISYINRGDGLTLDAIGPENFTYSEFIQLISRVLNRKILLVIVPPRLGIFLGKVIGFFVKDVVLTSDELQGLMANKLTSSQAPNAGTCFSEWLIANKNTLGTSYTSELQRHFR
jgi:NADH dehydrogenase